MAEAHHGGEARERMCGPELIWRCVWWHSAVNHSQPLTVPQAILSTLAKEYHAGDYWTKRHSKGIGYYVKAFRARKAERSRVD